MEYVHKSIPIAKPIVLRLISWEVYSGRLGTGRNVVEFLGKFEGSIKLLSITEEFWSMYHQLPKQKWQSSTSASNSNTDGTSPDNQTRSLNVSQHGSSPVAPGKKRSRRRL